ncbi:TonB-dependent receptor [Pontibacter sp. E15-1]|uniref:TonB-dependent receptor n=1 Tax=Pontibacter sp. E15-1 TaxID=2919918 RepID=UPI001F4FC22E|nr:TonB-dependent receptor [Pontibacter sp. E15-1]MCJ8163436.1 TonB-dependent receptor [Pontibacter sp. E15-1]
MKKLPLLLFLSLLYHTSALAFIHSGIIKGNVRGQADHTPLAGASVSVVSHSIGTTTDVFGEYALTNLTTGTYTVRVSYIGYTAATYTVQVQDGETTILHPRLERGMFDLSEITVSGGKEKPLNAISAIDVAMRPVRSSQDVLRSVPGLFIAQHAGGGKAEQIFLRGFDVDHGTDMRLTVDGMPVNMVSHAHGQGYADLHFLIPETIESIDYGKGPYQASQGNFATAGYASFATRPSLSNSSITLEAGRFDTYRAAGLFDLLGEAAGQKQQHAYLATEYMFTNGYFESPQNFNRINLMGRYQGMIGSNKLLSVSLSTFRSRWDASGQVPNRAIKDGTISRFGSIDDTEGGITSRQNANAILTSILPNGATLENQVYFVKYDFELYSNFTFFLRDSRNGDQIRQREDRSIYGYRSTYSHSGELFGKTLKSETGISLRYDAVQDSELSRTKGRRVTLSEVKKGDIEEVNAAAYTSHTLALTPRWSLNAVLRFDQFLFGFQDKLTQDSLYRHQTAQQHKASPKLNLFYTHSPQLQLYASAGKGFHSNDTRVSVVAARNEILPSALGADLGFVYKPVPVAVLQAAVWFLDLEQEFVYVGDEGIVEPIGKTRRYGLDLTARYQLAPTLFADADVSLARPRAREAAEGSNYIPLAPSITGTGGLTRRSDNGFFGSLRYRYLKSRPANEDYSLTASGYLLLDAVAGYTFKSLELKLTAENLLNEKWKEAQFETESRLRNEPESVTEIHFTPGTPFYLKASATYKF